MGKDPVGEGSRRRKVPASWRRRGSEYLDAVRPTRVQRKRKSLKGEKEGPKKNVVSTQDQERTKGD